jgi:hypothetical protein
MIPDRRIERLPQWAQREIQSLRIEVAALRRAQDTQTETDVRVRSYIGDTIQYLDPDAYIEFAMGPYERIRVRRARGGGATYTKISGDDHYIEISGDGALTLDLQAANVVKVRPVP